MGCAQLVYLASIHPTLFHSLILIEPVVQPSHPPGPNAALFSSLRREKWESRCVAEQQIRKNGFFASMDPRCLDLFCKHALRDLDDGGVVLSTPKAQEAWSYVRSNLPDLSENTMEGRRRERLLSPEIMPFDEPGRLLSCRPEMVRICDALPQIRPRVCYIYGEYSHINFDEVREYHVSSTGHGAGGDGGVKEGGVCDHVLTDCGHLCVFEKPDEIGKHVAEWVKKEVERWKSEKEFWDTVDTKKSKNGRTELSDEWISMVKRDTAAERKRDGEKAKL